MNSLHTQQILGARTKSNSLWTLVLGIGSLGFMITGLGSYPLNPWGIVSDFAFIPQGLVMSFYGFAGWMLASYLACTMAWNVGAGYNEIDYGRGVIIVFRWGFPGSNRRLRFRVLLRDVEAVVVCAQKSWWARPKVFLQLHNGQRCPWELEPSTASIDRWEGEAASLAHALRVPLYLED